MRDAITCLSLFLPDGTAGRRGTLLTGCSDGTSGYYGVSLLILPRARGQEYIITGCSVMRIGIQSSHVERYIIGSLQNWGGKVIRSFMGYDTETDCPDSEGVDKYN